MEVIVLGCTRKPDLERPRPAVCQEDDYVCVFFYVWGRGEMDRLSLEGPRTGSEKQDAAAGTQGSGRPAVKPGEELGHNYCEN